MWIPFCPHTQGGDGLTVPRNQKLAPSLLPKSSWVTTSCLLFIFEPFLAGRVYDKGCKSASSTDVLGGIQPDAVIKTEARSGMHSLCHFPNSDLPLFCCHGCLVTHQCLSRLLLIDILVSCHGCILIRAAIRMSLCPAAFSSQPFQVGIHTEPLINLGHDGPSGCKQCERR